MELLARLEPRLDPNEALMPGLTERRTIELKTNDITSQVLGRGNITGISDHSIGKNVVQITFDEFSRDEQSVRATLLKDADHCKVHVNGMRFPETQRTTFLSSGDVISLDGLRYEYRLHISHFEGDMSTAKRKRKVEEAISISSTPSRSPETVAAAAAHSAQEGAVTLSSDMANKLSYEIQCSVCLDIQVYPRTLDPCGHSFCAVCLQKLTNCPQCRETINSHVPAMQLDSLICMLVSVPSLLDSDDVAHFHERKKGAKVKPVVYQNKKRSAKRGRDQTGRISRDDFYRVAMERSYAADPLDFSVPRDLSRQRPSRQRISGTPGSHPQRQNLPSSTQRTQSAAGTSSTNAISIN